MSDTSIKLSKVGEALTQCLQTTRAGRQPIVLVLPTNSQGDPRSLLPYGEFVHGAARSAADVVELVPTLFPAMAFDAGKLRKLEEDVRADDIIVRQVDSVVASLRQDCSESKEQLCSAVTLVRDTVRAAWDNPCTPPDVRRLLEVHGKPLLGLVQERFDDISARRDANRNLKAAATQRVESADATADAAKLTVRVLRGGDVPAEGGLRRADRGGRGV